MPKRITAVLFMGILNMLLSTPALAEPDNKYDLIRENEFTNRFSREVEPCWSRGKIGRFKGVNGLDIHYITFINPEEKGAIVISNGRTESYIKYKELIYDLGRQGYSVYAYDHRGQGFSQRILPDPYKGHVDTFEDYVDDLDKFVKEVVMARPHKKLFLLAHSMGGGIATRYIEVCPDIFDAAALSSPMHAPDARIFISPKGGCLWFRFTDWLCKDCYAGFFSKPYNPEPFDDNEYTHSAERYSLLLKTYKENDTVQMGGPTRGWVGESCAASATLLDETKRITIPVLVLQAGDDTAVTPEGQDEFCRNLQRDTGKACYTGGPVTFAGAKHELFMESDKYRIPAINTILDFFAEMYENGKQ